jgi:hypothetical protein
VQQIGPLRVVEDDLQLSVLLEARPGGDGEGSAAHFYPHVYVNTQISPGPLYTLRNAFGFPGRDPPYLAALSELRSESCRFFVRVPSVKKFEIVVEVFRAGEHFSVVICYFERGKRGED